MTARVQHPAPDFKCQAMVNGEFKETSLADFKGKYVCLFFYPLDFTFVCPSEILAFQQPRRRVQGASAAEVIGGLDRLATSATTRGATPPSQGTAVSARS